MPNVYGYNPTEAQRLSQLVGAELGSAVGGFLFDTGDEKIQRLLMDLDKEKLGMMREERGRDSLRFKREGEAFNLDQGIRRAQLARGEQDLGFDARRMAMDEGQDARNQLFDTENLAGLKQQRSQQGAVFQQGQSDRQAAMGGARMELRQLAEQFPEMQQAMASIEARGLTLPPEARRALAEQSLPALFQLGESLKAERYADSLLQGLKMGEFATPGWEELGVVDREGKPAPDPVGQQVMQLEQRLRQDPSQLGPITEQVDAIRLEQTKGLFTAHMKETNLAAGQARLEALANIPGFDVNSPLYQGLAINTFLYASGYLDAEKYAANTTKLLMGPLENQARQGMPADKSREELWHKTLDNTFKQYEGGIQTGVDKKGKPVWVFPGQPGYDQEVMKAAKRSFDAKMAGPGGMAQEQGQQLKPFADVGKEERASFEQRIVEALRGGAGEEAFQQIAAEMGIDLESMPGNVADGLIRKAEGGEADPYSDQRLPVNVPMPQSSVGVPLLPLINPNKKP